MNSQKKTAQLSVFLLKKIIARNLRDYLRDIYLIACNKVTLLRNSTAVRHDSGSKRKSIISKYLLVRILGNDLYPRHATNQTLINLEFILKNEPSFQDCRKLFILNRIIDEEREQDLINLLESYSIDYIRIPFIPEEYAQTGWRIEEFGGMEYFSSEEFYHLYENMQKQIKVWAMSPKICYAMNVNGARNLAIDEGKRTAIWTFVLDGSCIFTEKNYQLLRIDCEKKPYAPYVIIPFARLTHNDKYLNDVIVTNIKSEEPQIGFHSRATEYFDERLPYGIVDKAEMLKRLGVPGIWNNWGESSWIKEHSKVSTERYFYKKSKGVVYRLSSGDHGLEENSAGSLRHMSRLDSIIGTIRHLEEVYGTNDEAFSQLYKHQL